MDLPQRARLAACLPALLAAVAAAPPACGSERAGQPATSPATRPVTLTERAAAAISQYESESNAVVGALAVNLRTGRALFGVRPTQTFIPASNQKLLTAAFALARLGGDFQFQTAAYAVGDDLWLLGSGDPTFADPAVARAKGQSIYAELDRWAVAIRKARPKGIPGSLVAFSCYTPGQKTPLATFRHPRWPKRQHQYHYAAPVAGLNLYNNCLAVAFRRAADGGIAPILTPASRFIRVIDRARRDRRHAWYLQSRPDQSAVTLRGAVRGPSPDPLPVAAEHPPLLLARVLADRLVRAGVPLAGRFRAADGPNLAGQELPPPLCRTLTPLADVLTRANKKSLNMAAECLLLRAGDGDWASSAEIMTRTLTRDHKLADGALTVSDGGGLSPDNRVSPRAMVRVLAGVLRRKDALVLLRSLPVAGADGTLGKRLERAPYKGRVLAKTGYVLGACCLSGYVLDARRRPAVAFAFLVNRVPPARAWVAKQLQDALCRLLVDALDARGPQAP